MKPYRAIFARAPPLAFKKLAPPPLTGLRANVLRGAAPLAEDDALRLVPFPLHAVLAPDFRRAALEQVANITIGVQFQVHCLVAPEGTAVPVHEAFYHALDFRELLVLAPFGRQVKKHVDMLAEMQLACLTHPDRGERDAAPRQRLAQAFAHLGEATAVRISLGVGAVPLEGAMGVQEKANFSGILGRVDNAIGFAE